MPLFFGSIALLSASCESVCWSESSPVASVGFKSDVLLFGNATELLLVLVFVSEAVFDFNETVDGVAFFQRYIIAISNRKKNLLVIVSNTITYSNSK